MFGHKTSKSDHKDSPSETSPHSKRSTIRNILKSFPTPSIRSSKGHQQAHGVRESGEGTSASRKEEGIPDEDSQNLGVSDERHESESTLKMPMQGEHRGGEEEGAVGGSESAATSHHNIDNDSKLPDEGEGGGGGDGGSIGASQRNFGGDSNLLNQRGEGGVGSVGTNLLSFDNESDLLNQREGGGGGASASQDNLNSVSKLPSLGEEEGGEEGEAASQHNLNKQEQDKLIPATSKDDLRPDETHETDPIKGKVGRPITHTFSFNLSDLQKQQEPQPDSSSESHPLTTTTGTPSTQQPHPSVVAGASKPRTKTKKHKGLSIASRDGKDSDSSVCSRKRSSKSKTKIKSKFAPGSLEYIEERLRGRVFSGWVEERQWVESVGGYRDVIEVDEWEVEMNQQLQTIISSIPGVQDGTRWINITPPDKHPYYCLWVLLEAPPTPGHYWYTIKGIKLQPQFGLMISVKEIRSIHPHDGELAAARRKRLKKKSQGAPQNELESVSDVLQDWMDNFASLRPATVLSAITSTLTLSNIKETIRFLTVLLMTLVIGLVTFLRESHVIGLRFVREAGIFVHNATPFLQTILGFFEKIVGGMYLLVAMVYRDFRRPSVPPPSRFPPPPTPALTPSPPRPTTGPRAIQYVSPERWVVRTQNNEFT